MLGIKPQDLVQHNGQFCQMEDQEGSGTVCTHTRWGELEPGLDEVYRVLSTCITFLKKWRRALAVAKGGKCDLEADCTTQSGLLKLYQAEGYLQRA